MRTLPASSGEPDQVWTQETGLALAVFTHQWGAEPLIFSCKGSSMKPGRESWSLLEQGWLAFEKWNAQEKGKRACQPAPIARMRNHPKDPREWNY